VALYSNTTFNGDVEFIDPALTETMGYSWSRSLPSVETHVVQEGDTLSAIAEAYDTDTATLLSLNDGLDADILAPGQPLKVIKAFHGLIYTVQSGDTLEGVARVHDIDADTILMANGVQVDAGLREGETLFLPGARLRSREVASRGGARSAPPPATDAPADVELARAEPRAAAPAVLTPEPEPEPEPAPEPEPEPVEAGDGWMWPIVGGLHSSEFGWRDMGDYHTGIDIAVPAGTPAVAARGGVVELAGWDGGYGLCVIIDHGDGTRTRYAHASSLYVSVGQRVAQGDAVIAVGTTGNSTGNHLHFEILVNGKAQNPRNYLP
jgi:murein DD-endopeptidase MepM/ murein hydrolase activator NlpD